MNKIVNAFFEAEKSREIRLEMLPNGIKYIVGKGEQNNNLSTILHTRYKALTDEQIDFLQDDVNSALISSYVFPEWYRDFLKTTNGCNLFFSSLCLFAEQTPWIYVKKYECYRRSLIDSANPEWMAPYNLRSPRTIKLDSKSRERWLTLGEYTDGTSIEWDFKNKKIVAMYALPLTTTIRELKQFKESDFEKMICAQWDTFDDFFLNETERLKIINKLLESNKDQYRLHWKKTLPLGHKDHQD